MADYRTVKADSLINTVGSIVKAGGSADREAIHRATVRKNGLLRGACHRARIRATRWLAMTAVTAPPTLRPSVAAADEVILRRVGQRG